MTITHATPGRRVTFRLSSSRRSRNEHGTVRPRAERVGHDHDVDDDRPKESHGVALRGPVWRAWTMVGGQSSSRGWPRSTRSPPDRSRPDGAPDSRRRHGGKHDAVPSVLTDAEHRSARERLPVQEIDFCRARSRPSPRPVALPSEASCLRITSSTAWDPTALTKIKLSSRSRPARDSLVVYNFLMFPRHPADDRRRDPPPERTAARAPAEDGPCPPARRC